MIWPPDSTRSATASDEGSHEGESRLIRLAVPLTVPSGPCYAAAIDTSQTRAAARPAPTASLIRHISPAPGGLGFGALFAICMLVALPVMLVFIFLQNWLVRGLAAGAVKG